MQVVDRFAGSVLDSPYLGTYERRTTPWRMALAEVDGELTVISMDQRDGAWVPRSIVRLDVLGDRVVGIADYAHCPWVIAAADWSSSRAYLELTGSRNTRRETRGINRLWRRQCDELWCDTR